MNHLNHQEHTQKVSGSRNTLVMCLALLVVAFVAVVVFKVSLGSVALFGLVLACPLLHLWMMKDGGHKH